MTRDDILKKRMRAGMPVPTPMFAGRVRQTLDRLPERKRFSLFRYLPAAAMTVVAVAVIGLAVMSRMDPGGMGNWFQALAGGEATATVDVTPIPTPEGTVEETALETLIPTETPMGTVEVVDTPVTTPELTLAQATQESRSGNKDFLKIGNDLLKADGLGSLKLGMTTSELIAYLGKPESETEPLVWGSDGSAHYTANYPSLGLTIGLVEEDHSGTRYVVCSIQAVAPCGLATRRGLVRIGDTKDAVITAYADSISDEDTGSESIVAGSVYGGILFGLKDGIVESIFIGAAAE